MKNLFLASVFILLFTINIADAQIVDKVRIDQDSFSIDISDITYYKNIKSTQFFVNMEGVKNPGDISYWKVGAICDDKMTIRLAATSTDICGKSIRLKSIPNDSFYFLFRNKTPKLKDFSIKVKAFNEKGKGLYGDSVGFGWK